MRGADEPSETFVRFVPRQDMLLISETRLSPADLASVKRGDDIKDKLTSLVALRESLPPLQTFHG